MGLLRSAGMAPALDRASADVAFINTCAFIADSAQESVDTILEFARDRRDGKIDALVVAGCLAQRYGRSLMEEIPEIDALIGTGLKHHVKESTAELITAMNDSEAVIVSVDVPSGMFSDSGCAAGAVVNADYTVALGSVKRGHVLYPGNGYAGTVLYSPIGIPNGAREHFPVKLV